MEEGPRFNTHEEELKYLHERIAQMERNLRARGEEPHVEQVIRHEIEGYGGVVKHDRSDLVLDIAPDNNDAVISEFLGLLQERGIIKALAAIESLGDAHLMDDVHRFLVQYIKEGYIPEGLTERMPLHRQLRYTLLQVLFPKAEQDEGKPEPVNHNSVGQFLTSLSSLYALTKKEGITIGIELASPLGIESVVSYVAVPDEHVELVSQQLRAAFKGVKLVVTPNDYNAFVEGGTISLSYAQMVSAPILPLQTAGEDATDALRSMYIALSEVGNERGAAIQFIIRPGDDSFAAYGHRVVQEIQKGASRAEALKTPRTHVGTFVRDFGRAFAEAARGRKDEEGKKDEKLGVDNELLTLVNEKLSSPAYQTVVRVLASSTVQSDSDALLSRLQGPFAQFARGSGNAITFTRDDRAGKDFSYRAFESKRALNLAVHELAMMVPLGSRLDIDLPELTQAKSIEVPAPLDLPKEGIWLGDNIFRDQARHIFLTPEDRLRHVYTIGQTGTGKSTFLKHLILQDMQAGNGVCFIDPHGSDVVDLLSLVPPERYGDVIYFDPAYRDRTFGLNLLEYDESYPEQKTFVVNELLNIFRKLYGSVPESMGPAFEQYFRNATLLVMEDPASGNTLLDIARVLSDGAFRSLKLSRSKNGVVNRFWNDIASKAGGDAALENIVPYITNKFDDFTANDMMRPIIAQERSSLRFREIMDSKKILLVNLAKGRLGERNAHLLGLVLVGKIFMAALSRVDATSPLPPFHLYIDEFHNLTTDSISQILSEARKYGLAMTLAHQFMAQIPDDIHDAVFGNVGSLIAFRVGADDAEALDPIFGGVFGSDDLINIENYNAHIRLLSRGVPQPPFTLRTPPLPSGNQAQVDDLRTLSYLTYAKDRAAVEERIRQRMGI